MNWKQFPICWKLDSRKRLRHFRLCNDFKKFLVGDVGLEPTTR